MVDGIGTTRYSYDAMGRLAVTIPLDRTRWLDLFAPELRRSPLADRWQICARLTPRLARKSTAPSLSSQQNGHGLASEDGPWANDMVSYVNLANQKGVIH
jgi:hypothetical protein